MAAPEESAGPKSMPALPLPMEMLGVIGKALQPPAAKTGAQ